MRLQGLDLNEIVYDLVEYSYLNLYAYMPNLLQTCQCPNNQERPRYMYLAPCWLVLRPR